MAVNHLPSQIGAFEAANRSAGAFASERIREPASRFYNELTYGSALKEPMLRVRLALDRSARAEMSELWSFVLHPTGAGGESLDKLDAWMSRNKGLVGLMSGATQAMLRGLVAHRGEATKVQAELDRAGAAVRAAFGAKAESAEGKGALDELASQSRAHGSALAAYSAGVERISRQARALLLPGAREALADLGRALGDPGIDEMARRQKMSDWRQKHPALASVLLDSEKGSQNLGLFHENMRVADWSDQRFRAAEEAVLRAFGRT